MEWEQGLQLAYHKVHRHAAACNWKRRKYRQRVHCMYVWNGQNIILPSHQTFDTWFSLKSLWHHSHIYYPISNTFQTCAHCVLTLSSSFPSKLSISYWLKQALMYKLQYSSLKRSQAFSSPWMSSMKEGNEQLCFFPEVLLLLLRRVQPSLQMLTYSDHERCIQPFPCILLWFWLWFL